jgi:hypothetical protein
VLCLITVKRIKLIIVMNYHKMGFVPEELLRYESVVAVVTSPNERESQDGAKNIGGR